jgi:hypothetical protein
VENDRVESDTIEEAQAMGELVNLVEDSAADLDDSELGGVRRVGRGGEDTEVPLDLAFCADRVEKTGDGIL